MNRIWAGIGSRNITTEEAASLRQLAAFLSTRGWWLHSGNADGADAAFQSGAGGRGTAFLPWPSHAPGNLCGMEACTEIAPEALDTARRLHPAGARLHGRSLLYMARNVQIVEGLRGTRPVAFVACCADPLPEGVAGGSQLAWSLARERGIPFLNLRTAEGWRILADLIGAPPPPHH